VHCLLRFGGARNNSREAQDLGKEYLRGPTVSLVVEEPSFLTASIEVRCRLGEYAANKDLYHKSWKLPSSNRSLAGQITYDASLPKWGQLPMTGTGSSVPHGDRLVPQVMTVTATSPEPELS
jgi:hypothetical protein